MDRSSAARTSPRAKAFEPAPPPPPDSKTPPKPRAEATCTISVNPDIYAGLCRTIFVTDDALLPIGRRRRGAEIIRCGSLKYERVTEEGIEYQRLLDELETHAGPWRLLNGEMA